MLHLTIQQLAIVKSATGAILMPEDGLMIVAAMLQPVILK